MKIKLAILEKDAGYLKRIVAVFQTKYAENLEVYSFTDDKIAMEALHDTKIDVLLASDLFEIDCEKLPRRCGFAYLVDASDVDSVNGQAAICKFQKADLIYRQILSLYSENISNISGMKLNMDGCKVVIFSSISGGTGSSSMAAACAYSYAKKGKKALYLNLESFGGADVFFSAEGQFSMSDIIYTLKSHKANLALKLESCVRQDGHGVYFFSQSQMALDMMELGNEEILRMLSELKLSGSYDVIVVDMDFGLDKKHLEIYQQANAIAIVGDGSEISNSKIFRAYQSLMSLEQGMDVSVSNRISILYNQFSNKTGKVLENIEWKNAGGAPRYEHATTEQILEQLSSLAVFENIMQ